MIDPRTSPSNAGGGAAAPADEPQTMPLLTGVTRPEGLPAVADLDFNDGKPGRGVSHGTLLLLGIILLAAGTLYVMRTTSGDLRSAKGATDIEARIEQALAKLTARDVMASDDPLARQNMDALFHDTNTIVAMFSGDNTQRQVPLEFVQKNPFELPQTRAVESELPLGRGDDRRERDLARKLDAEFKALQLQSVMLGRVPVAIISGQFYQPAQKVGSFTIKAIKERSVELEAGGKRYELTMQDDSGRSRRR